MSSSGEDEERGPSIDSSNPEERIAARRLRIQRRLDALKSSHLSEAEKRKVQFAKRAQLGEDASEKKETKEELSKSRQQMEVSRVRLTKLKDDGGELITNIRVAADMRESDRRKEEDEAKRLRREKIEAEAKAGTDRFEEISKKWESALKREIPQDLHEMLMQQKKFCDSMIDEKNKLINDFQLELKQKDDHYVKDLRKQAEDIDMMVERMDALVKQLMGARRDELEEIERAFVTERSEMSEQHRKKWDTMMQLRREKELEYMKAREKRVEDYETQLQHLRVMDAEEYNIVKIKLETDVQVLEQQLQQMRATYQLNQEKLEYNFQVLRKRDEENTITKSQQKRKITRLQDIKTNLKAKLTKQEKQYRDDNVSLSEDYKRITEQFKELQKKSKHFMAADARKFEGIWVMNENEAKELVHRVVEQNRSVHEQQLGLPFSEPDLEFLDNVGPLISEKTKRKAIPAHQIVQEVLSQTSADSDKGSAAADTAREAGTEDNTSSSILLQKFSPELVKSILDLLCDESGFLIESKLNTLLTPLGRDDQSLMKLDAIFAALGVETEDDVQNLSNYFLTVRENSRASSRQSVAKQDGEQQSDRAGEKQADDRSPRSGAGDDPGAADDSELRDLIHPNDVLKALRTFVDETRQQNPKSRVRHGQFCIEALEERDSSEDSEYWARYPAVLPDSTERMWDALIDGLQKYSETLLQRASLIQETESLAQQNSELRMLLHQYVNSKVNQELEIPPTRVLQVETHPQ